MADLEKEKSTNNNAHLINNQNLNKEKQEEKIGHERLNKDNQLKFEEIQDTTHNLENLFEDEANEDENNEGKPIFIHKANLKDDAFLQVDSWLYNKIINLKKKMGELQNNLDEERTKIIQLENQMGNIPKKLKAYEIELHQLVKDNNQKMDMVTSSLCAVVVSIGRKSNKEIISPAIVHLIGGPSKRTKQSKKNFFVVSPGSAMEDILQGTVVVGNEIAKVMKELA